MTSTEFPRQFVRSGEELTEWGRIDPYFRTLLSARLETPQQLNEWLLDCSELAACIDQVGKARYVRMTCQTDDAERKHEYLDFVENIEPKCKPLWNELDRKFAECPVRESLPAERFAVFNRNVRNRVSLFREENVPLQVEEAKLEQQYQEIVGAMTVQYDGREQTMQQLSAYLERTDRAVRQDVWKMSTKRRLEDADRIEDVFDALFKLRHRIATNAGYDNFQGYAFAARERFDYTPDDCEKFHDAIERACVPLFREVERKRAKMLAADPLRPWDLAVDVKGRPPLEPFSSTQTLVERCQTIFERIEPDLGDQFREMANRGELDLDSRKGKAPGGYQSTFHETRRPFIFMNAVGMVRDVRTLIHEGGHAFHAVASRSEPLLEYRSAPIEFAEVASMGMEMLAYDHLDVFFSNDELARAKRGQLEGIVSLFPWVATIDAFQHWMYTHPEHTRDERRDKWLELHERFGGIDDYSGYEDAKARRWQRQLHLFEVPFYYVEYGIAQLGALQVWQNAKRNHPKALADYRKGLSLGGSRPLPALFESAGVRFDFSYDTLMPLIEAIQAELETLDP